MDFQFKSFSDVLHHFSRRKTPPLLRSTLDPEVIKNGIKLTDCPQEQARGLRILGRWNDIDDLPFVQEMCCHSNPHIASAAANALLCLCCQTLPPLLSPLMQQDLPDICHYSILRELGEWLDIRYAEPVPLPNHTLLLAHLAPYFGWLLEHGSLSRKIQTTMLLCRSGQRQFLPQMALLLEIDTQIPFMDWDDLFWVKHMSPVRTSAADIPEEEQTRFYAENRRRSFNAFFDIVGRTEPLRDAMVGWLNELDAKAAQLYFKPWLNTLGRAVCQSDKEAFSVQDPPPKIHTLIKAEKNLIEAEKSQKIAQSRTAKQWLDALCQLDDKELAYQAATSLCLLEARFCLPHILDFLKLAYTYISADANEEVQHRPQLSVFAELGDAAWIPALLDFISEQKALSYSDTHNLVNHIIGPWLKQEHGSLLWETFRSTKASDKQAVFLEMLCKITDRSWMPKLVSLLDESDSDLVDQVAEWLAPLVKPEDFALLKPYLSPEHPAFKSTYRLMELMVSEEVKIHAQSILDTYLFRDQLFFSALLWQ